MYKIIRFFATGSKEVIETDLTLEEAQAYCKDKETSWKTATSKAAKKLTTERGPWFDGYEEE